MEIPKQPVEQKLSEVLYVIYQPIPHREKLYIWVNGEKRKEIIKIEAFKRWIVDSKQEHLLSDIMKTMRTYSFFLWDKKNGQAYYLQPNIHNNDYKKPLPEEIKEDTRKKKEKEDPDPNKRAFDQFTMIDLKSAKNLMKL